MKREDLSRKNFIKKNIENLGRLEARIKVKRAQEEISRSLEKLKAKKLKVSIENQIKKKKVQDSKNPENFLMENRSSIEDIMKKMFLDNNENFTSRNSNLLSVERFSELLENGDFRYDNEMIRLSKFDENNPEYLSEEMGDIGFRELEISQYRAGDGKSNFDNGTFGDPNTSKANSDVRFRNSQYSDGDIESGRESQNFKM